MAPVAGYEADHQYVGLRPNVEALEDVVLSKVQGKEEGLLHLDPWHQSEPDQGSFDLKLGC